MIEVFIILVHFAAILLLCVYAVRMAVTLGVTEARNILLSEELGEAQCDRRSLQKELVEVCEERNRLREQLRMADLAAVREATREV